MKRLFSNIKQFFSKINWIVRRKLNQFKSVIVSNIAKAYAIVTKKDYRLAKGRVKNDYIKDYVELDDYNLDVRFDVDVEKLRKEVIEEHKANLKNEEVKLFLSLNEELAKEEQTRLKAIYDERIILATELEKNIRELEFERERQIRNISVEKNVYAEEIEKVSTEISSQVETLRVQYNQKSKELALKHHVEPETDMENKVVVSSLRVKEAYRCLPESRQSKENKDRRRQVGKNLLQAFLYLAPVMLFLVIFTFYPIINSFRLVMFLNYDDVSGNYSGFTLLGNFKKVLSDANFIVPGKYVKSSAMINTLLIVGITVPVSIIISLLIAVLLNSIKVFTNALQTIFFLPYVTNSIAVGLVFAYMFQNNGLFNKFLAWFSVDGGRWVQHGAPYWKAMFVLMLFSIWNGLAFKIMVFLSAIQGIDKQYYQAASIDATPRFKQFRRITAPLISPTILYIVITSVIGSFKTYSSVIAIFGNRGRPPGADYHLKTIVFYIYDYFAYSGKMPEAAAASIVLFGIILVMTLVQMQVSKKRVHY